MNLIQLADNLKELIAEPKKCTVCFEKYFSPFDKAFIVANNGVCYGCAGDSDQVELLADNVLEIVSKGV